MALALLALGSVLFLTGRWADAGESLERGIGLAESVEAEQVVVHGQQRLALLETAEGRSEAARRRLDAAIERAERSSSAQVRHHSRTRLYAALARNRLQAGDVDAAAEAVRSAHAVRRDVGACLTCDALLHPVSVPVALAGGRLDVARLAAEQATESGAEFQSGAWRAAAAHARGLLAIADDDIPAAVRDLDSAGRTFAALGQPYDEARSLEALAIALRGDAGARRDRYVSTHRRAAAIYARLGAAPDSDRLAGVAALGKMAGRSVS